MSLIVYSWHFLSNLNCKAMGNADNRGNPTLDKRNNWFNKQNMPHNIISVYLYYKAIEHG